MATQTISITNFQGRLTRVINGDLNSGFAKFDTSWGYDPFSKPGNLMWNYQTSSVAAVTGLVLAGTPAKGVIMHMIDSGGQYYIMGCGFATTTIPDGVGMESLRDSVLGVYNMSSIAGTLNYGSSMEPFNNKFVFSTDNTIVWVDADPDTFPVIVDSFNSVTGSASSVLVGVPHPLAEFQGDLYYGNGNNIGRIEPLSTFGTITSGAVLSPALPTGLTVTDLDVTPEGDYMLITASYTAPPWFGSASTYFTDATKRLNAAQSFVFYWNGSDGAVTAARTLPSFPAPALSTFLDKQYTVMQDTFGMALMEGNQKLLTLPNNINPSANALSPNGTFLTWVDAEGVGTVTATSSVYSSVVTALYYFGKLDEENPAGLWRMNRISPINNRVMRYTPYNLVFNNFSAYANVVQSFGRHYISTDETFFPAGGATSVISRLHRFVLNPAADTAPTLGVYETQTQLFSKRIGVSQIRVYCDPTVEGNGFRLDLIGSNGNPIEEATYTYTFGDIVDPQDGSASVERINFPGNIKTQYSLGVRITNTGTKNMTIRKVELDISEEGK